MTTMVKQDLVFTFDKYQQSKDEDYKSSYFPKNPRMYYMRKRVNFEDVSQIEKECAKMADKDYILEAKGTIYYQAIPYEYREDTDFVLKVLGLNSSSGVFYIYLPLSMRKDEELCIKAIQNATLTYHDHVDFQAYIPENLKKSKRVFAALANSNICSPMLEHYPKEFQTVETVDLILAKTPEDYQFVTDELKKEKKILLHGIKYDAKNFVPAPEEFKNDLEFVKLAVSLNKKVYPKIGNELKKDRKIIEIALKETENLLSIPDEIIEKDKEYYIQMIKTRPTLSNLLPVVLQKDAQFLKDITSETTWRNFTPLCFETLLTSDEQFVLDKITEYPKIVNGVAPLHHHLKIVKHTIKLNPDFIRYLTYIEKGDLLMYLEERPELVSKLHQKVRDMYQNDYDYQTYLIREDPTKFKDMAPLIRSKEELKKYLKISGNCLCFIDKKYRSDKEMVMVAVTSNGEAVEYVDGSLLSDIDVMLAAVTNYGRALSYGSPEIQDNYEIVKEAVRNNGTAIKFASPRLKLDPELSLIAIEQTRTAYRDLAPSMKTHIDIWLVFTKRYQKLQPSKQEKLQDIHFNYE